MKKIYPYLIIPIFIILLTIILMDRKEQPNNKVITVLSNNTNLYHKENKIEFLFYINNNKHPLTNKDSYRDIIIKDIDENKALNLKLLDISYSHKEIYLKENYYAFNLIFDSVNLTNNYLINEAYLSINLINDENYLFKVGKFNITYLNDGIELPWSNLDSSKESEEDLSISNIIIELNENISNILNVYTNINESLKYDYTNDKLIISLNYINKLYNNNLPIIVETINNTYYINNHKYFVDYNLLNKSNEILNIYEVNWTKKR